MARLVGHYGRRCQGYQNSCCRVPCTCSESACCGKLTLHRCDIRHEAALVGITSKTMWITKLIDEMLFGVLKTGLITIAPFP